MSKRHITTNRPVKVETRADESEVITGYAAVFHRAGDEGTEYRLGADTVERVGRNAFDLGDDVRGAVNHSSDWILGRNKAGTMSLSVDDTGLRYEIPVNRNDPDHVRAVEKIQRGDIDGSSFAFQIKPSGEERSVEGGTTVRTLVSVKLFDLGPVTYPAYTGASSETREAAQELSDWRTDKETAKRKRDALARRVGLDSKLSG